MKRGSILASCGHRNTSNLWNSAPPVLKFPGYLNSAVYLPVFWMLFWWPLFLFFFNEASSERCVLINYHFTGLICSCIFGWKYGIKAKECSPTEQSDVESVHRAPSRGSLALEFTLSFSRPKQKQLGEEVRRWFRLCCVVCVCVLFWPKARKPLATAAMNSMNFLYFTIRMLPKRKVKQNYGGLLLFADSLSRQL